MVAQKASPQRDMLKDIFPLTLLPASTSQDQNKLVNQARPTLRDGRRPERPPTIFLPLPKERGVNARLWMWTRACLWSTGESQLEGPPGSTCPPSFTDEWSAVCAALPGSQGNPPI